MGIRMLSHKLAFLFSISSPRSVSKVLHFCWNLYIYNLTDVLFSQDYRDKNQKARPPHTVAHVALLKNSLLCRCLADYLNADEEKRKKNERTFGFPI